MAATRGTKNPTRKIGLLSKNTEVHFETDVWAQPTSNIPSKDESTVSIEKQFTKFLKYQKPKRKRMEAHAEFVPETEYHKYNLNNKDGD